MITRKISALILAGALLLSGCDATAKKAPKMFVEPTKLTKGEKELLDFVGTNGNIMLFDYTIDDTIKTITIDTLTLNDQGQWESLGGVTSTSNISEGKNKGGRIMISPNNDGSIKFAEQHENGTTSYTSDAKFLDSLVGDGGKLTNQLQGTVEVVYEVPIPLVMFARSTKDTIRSYALSEYQNTALLEDYNAVSVITICFSQKGAS